MTTRTILLLEDDPSVIRLLETELGLAGFRTVETRTVGDAWKEIQSRDVDAAIVDIRLPGVYGWEFVERLRRDPLRERLPILIVSGDLGADDLRRSSELDCHVMGKPFEAEALVARVQELIGSERKIELHKHGARVLMDSFAIEGDVYLPPDRKRFSDGMEELMADDRSFVPMTRVRILSFRGELLYESPFLQVNKAQIRALIALEDR